MPIQINKDVSGRVIKKENTTGTGLSGFTTGYLVSQPSSLFNTRNYDAVINTVETTSGSATLTTDSLNLLSATEGTAASNKALIADSTGSIGGLNIVKCKSITVNGVVIDPNASTENAVPSTDYYTGITAGTVSAEKTVVADSNLNVYGFKKIIGESNGTIGYGNELSTGISINNILEYTSEEWYDAEYSIDLQKFLCVGKEKIMISTTGSTWETIAVTGVTFKEVKWAPNKGKFYAACTTGVYTSVDGRDWTQSLSNNNITSVAVGSNIIAAVGVSTLYITANETTWTPVSVTDAFTSITYGKGKFVIAGTNIFKTLTDATTPTLTTAANSPTGTWSSIAFGNSTFIAVSSALSNVGKFVVSGNGSNWSTDSYTWQSFETELASGWCKIKFLNNYFFVLPLAPQPWETQIYYTTAGTEWHKFKHSLSSPIAGICYSPVISKYMAVSRSKNTSLDTIANTMRLKMCPSQFSRYGTTTHGYVKRMQEIPETGMVFACGTDTLYYSTNGNEFKKAYMSYNGGNLFTQTNRYVFEIAYSSTLGIYVAGTVYSAGVFTGLMKSSDGINWTDITGIVSANFFQIIWSSTISKFIAAYANNLYISADGVTWNSQTYTGVKFIQNINGEPHVSGATDLKQIMTDLSYTVVSTNMPYSRVIKIGTTYYTITTNGQQIYTSSDLTTWTQLISFAASSSTAELIYHQDLNAIVAYVSDGTVRVYKNSAWTQATLSGTTTVINLGCYSPTYKCVFMPITTAVGVGKTFSTITQIGLSNNLARTEKIYRTLPSSASYLADFYDSIYLAFNRSTYTKTTATGANAYANIFYDSSNRNIILIKAAPTVSNLSTYSTTNGASWSSGNNFISVHNMSETETYYTYHKAGTTMEIVKASASAITATLRTPASDGPTSRIKKIYNRFAVYYKNSSYIYIQYYLQNMAFPLNQTYTATDYVIGKNSEFLYMLTGTRLIKYRIDVGVMSYISEVSMPSATYYQLDYFPEGDVLILTKSNGILYSTDAENWNTAVNSGTFSRNSMNYIPELKIFAAVTTNAFLYTFDGINWVTITTPISDAWTSFTYNTHFNYFMLHANVTGIFYATMPLSVTAYNIVAPTSSYISKKTYYHWPQTTADVGDTSSDNFTLDLNSSLVMQNGSKSLDISRSGDFLYLNNSSDVLTISKTDSSVSASNAFKINGSICQWNQTAFNSLTRITADDTIFKNSLVLSKNGNIKANNVTTNNITVNNSALLSNSGVGLVIADNYNNIAIKNVGSTKLSAGNVSLSNTKGKLKESITLTVDDYMTFRRLNMSNGITSSKIYDSAYSTELDTLVIYGDITSYGFTDGVYVTKDKGRSWKRVVLNSSTIYTSTTQEAVRTCKWFSQIKKFVIAGTNTIIYSADGYNWITVTVSFGSRPHLFYDSKINKIAVTTSTKVAKVDDINNLSGTWTINTLSTNYTLVEFSPTHNVYFVRDNTTTSAIKYIADVYATSQTPIQVTNSSVVNSFLEFKGGFYFSMANVVYKVSSGLATSTNTGLTMTTVKTLQYIETLDIMIALASNGFAWTSDGTNWSRLPYSSDLSSVYAVTSNEAALCRMHWAGDRAMLIMNMNGEVLESNIPALANESKNITPEYLHSMIKNRMASDVLYSAKPFNNSLYMKYSTTAYNLYAATYGNGIYVTVGTNVDFYTTQLKQNHTMITHTGNWVDIIYDGTQFVKIADNTIATGSTPANGWTVSTVTGNWFKIIYNIQDTVTEYILISSTDVQRSTNLSTWSSIIPSGITKVNGAKFVNNKLVLLGEDTIAVRDNNAWTVNTYPGSWYDIAYGRGLYFICGNGWMVRSRNLTTFKRSFIPRVYHSIIYSRLYGDFFLLNKGSNYIDQYTVSSIFNQKTAIVRSHDAINWCPAFSKGSKLANFEVYFSNIYYFDNCDQFYLPMNNSNNRIYTLSDYTIATTDKIKITTKSCVWNNGTNLDIARGNDLTTASPQVFNVFQDSAAKPATSTWTTASDVRLKEDIQPADVDMCLHNVKQIPLKYYKWKDQYVTQNHSNDRHKLGWIAQDVETVLPKSVKEQSMFGMEDCRTLDTDQIIANMFGAIKCLLKKVKEKEQALIDAGI